MTDIIELKPCPCGETPTSLIIREGETYRWRYISGNCCDGWMIESSRIEYNAPKEQIEKQCADDWNGASRCAQLLTQPQQEPVAWICEESRELTFDPYEKPHNYYVPLYKFTTPPDTQAKLDKAREALQAVLDSGLLNGSYTLHDKINTEVKQALKDTE